MQICNLGCLRTVLLISSVNISANDMAFFTNIYSVSVQNNRRIDIATDVYTAANSSYWFSTLPCSCLVAVAYCSVYSRCYAMRSHAKYTVLVVSLQTSYVANKMWSNAEISNYGIMGIL